MLKLKQSWSSFLISIFILEAIMHIKAWKENGILNYYFDYVIIYDKKKSFQWIS